MHEGRNALQAGMRILAHRIDDILEELFAKNIAT
jgi:hypothetical protein